MGVRLGVRGLVAWLVAGALVAACGSSHSEGGGASPGGGDDAGSGADATIAAPGTTIDAKGGTVTSSDGALTLTIPAGALASAIQVTITPATSAPAGFVGAAYDIEPTGTRFTTPVGVAFKYDSSFGDPSLLRVATLVGTTWAPLAFSASDGTTVIGGTTHFSSYAVTHADPCTTSVECDAPFQCFGGHCTIPCASDDQCPAPFACDAHHRCSPLPCQRDTDCTRLVPQLQRVPGSNVICGDPGFCTEVTAAFHPGMACILPPVGASPLAWPGGICPGAQIPYCEVCYPTSCPWYSGAGQPTPDCAQTDVCAYGSCWPSYAGCQCHGTDCSCVNGGPTDAGLDGSGGFDASGVDTGPTCGSPGLPCCNGACTSGCCDVGNMCAVKCGGGTPDAGTDAGDAGDAGDAAPPCGQSTCSSGCCDSSGKCITNGISNSNDCGIGGKSCVVCVQPQTCQKGTCF